MRADVSVTRLTWLLVKQAARERRCSMSALLEQALAGDLVAPPSVKHRVEAPTDIAEKIQAIARARGVPLHLAADEVICAALERAESEKL